MKHVVIHQPHTAHAYSSLILLHRYYSLKEKADWRDFRKKILANVMEKEGKLTCHYCHRDDLCTMSHKKHLIATLDHIVPRTNGGKDVDTNVVICCSRCNQKKSDTSQEEFYVSTYLQKKSQYTK